MEKLFCKINKKESVTSEKFLVCAFSCRIKITFQLMLLCKEHQCTTNSHACEIWGNLQFYQISEDGWGSGLEQAATWMLFFVDNFCCSCFQNISDSIEPPLLACQPWLYFYMFFSTGMQILFFFFFSPGGNPYFKDECRNYRICFNLFFLNFTICL